MHLPSFYYQAAVPRPHSYHAPSYYEIMNPYAPEYDDYYYQDPMTYPLYYPPLGRTADMYQPIFPYSYYYGPSYYDGTDPMEDIQDEMLQQEQEREQREEALPIGQETWFETDQHDDSIDDVNAAFMKNLMLYNNAMSTPMYDQQSIDPYNQNYDDLSGWNPEEMDEEDEDVQELKNLNENLKKIGNTKEERMQMFQKVNRNPKITRYQPNGSDNWMKYGNKRGNKPEDFLKNVKYQYAQQVVPITSRKPQGGVPSGGSTTSTESPFSVTPDSVNVVTAGRDARGGQKEVVMMRPATPVRRPFSEPVMKLLEKQGGPERKRTPSVYDTIKHMLEMEKSLEKVSLA